MSINACTCDGNTIIVKNHRIYINGVEVDNTPVRHNHNVNTCTSNGKIYVNGYEYKNSRWKRSLKAMFNCYIY